MNIRKLKEGPVQRYKSSFLTSKWKDSWAVLYSDSTLSIYNERGDSRPAESIFLRNVVPYVCVGQMTDRMPTRRPSLPPGVSIQRLVGVGMDPRAEKVHWVLFPSEKDLEDWFNEITTTLPMPAQPPPSAPGQAPPPYPATPAPNSGGYVPPVRYPNAPPPVGGYHQGNTTGGYSPQPQATAYQGYTPQPQATAYQGYTPYPNQPMMAGGYSQQQPPPPPQTVIIDRTAPSSGYGNRGSSGLGSGLAGFGGGMLAGSLLGYGIGSFFTPHYGGGWGGGGWGGGGGGGYPGSGFGGGYVQDNDTYNVTNNYYNNDNDNNHDSTSNQVSSPTANDTAATDYGQSEPAPNNYDDYNDGGVGGGWDNTGGSNDMFDSGGGFDSGDFGGGGGFDGGGGDW